VSELPKGWAIARLDELALTTSGGTPSRNEPTNFGGNILWFKSGELNDNSLPAWTEEKLTDKGLNNSSARLTPVGSVLIAMYGATVGKLGILQVPAATNQAICAATPKSGLETKYLFYFLQSQRPALLSQRVGGAQPNINQQIIRAVKVPLPPLPEQRRIVAEIEKQFTRLDAAVSSLRSIKTYLEKYRASTLKAACNGTLFPTDGERTSAAGDSRRKFLDQILAERRAKWEEDQLSKILEHAAAPANAKWKRKYKAPKDISGTVFQFPADWAVVTLGHVTWSVKDGPHFSPDYVEAGVPFITGGNVRPEGIDFVRCRQISLKVDLSPVLRQTVKTQYSSKGELSHGIVSPTVHERV
jgi:type I restriction enzyme S subunit